MTGPARVGVAPDGRRAVEVRAGVLLGAHLAVCRDCRARRGGRALADREHPLRRRSSACRSSVTILPTTRGAARRSASRRPPWRPRSSRSRSASAVRPRRTRRHRCSASTRSRRRRSASRAIERPAARQLSSSDQNVGTLRGDPSRRLLAREPMPRRNASAARRDGTLRSCSRPPSPSPPEASITPPGWRRAERWHELAATFRSATGGFLGFGRLAALRARLRARRPVRRLDPSRSHMS